MNKKVRWMGLLLACGASALAQASSEGRLTPPPGLYQIETKSEGYTLDGMGPRNVCVGPMHSIEIPADMLANGCTLTKGQVLSGQVLMQLSCPWNRTTSKTRQVDARTWETAVETVTYRGPLRADIGATMTQMKYMAGQVASSSHAGERAEAKSFLANAQQIETRLKNAAPPPVSAKTVELMAANEGIKSKVTRSMKLVGDCKS